MGSLRKDSANKSRPLVINTTNAENDNDVRGDLSHSPLESPPMLKKKLKRLSSALLGGLINANANSLPPQLVLADSKDCDSGENSPVSRSPSILKKEPFRTIRIKSAPNKKVQFDNDVTVHIMDDEGHLCTKCQELNGDAKSRKDFVKMHRQNSRRNRSQSLNACYSMLSTDYSNTAFGKTNNVPYNGQVTDSNANDISSTNNMSKPQVNITFEQDSEHGTKLKFLAFLGKEYHPDNVVVKANMHGSRIRVLATKMVTLEDGREVTQEFNERYSLPMNVDPFLVEAKLDSKGYLAVVAPLVTLAKRQTPGPETQTTEE